jgi:hypothetical protein
LATLARLLRLLAWLLILSALLLAWLLILSALLLAALLATLVLLSTLVRIVHWMPRWG